MTESNSSRRHRIAPFATVAVVVALCVAVALVMWLRGDDSGNTDASKVGASTGTSTPPAAETSAPTAAEPSAASATADANPPSQSPNRPPGARPEPSRGPDRIDLRTISFAEDRGRTAVFDVTGSRQQDEALLAALYADKPDRRPQESSPATDFTRNVVVTLSVEGGCLDPTGARLYAEGSLLKPVADFPDRTRPPECLAPYQRLARFEVPRDRLPEHPLLAGTSPHLPANTPAPSG